ncbi:MAG: hypothetical protein WCX64_06380 [Candidatus Micrarchaeia archaeon]
MPQQDDVASKLAILQADVEQLRREAEQQKAARAGLDAKVASLSDELSRARSETELLEKRLAELRLATERSSALLKTIEPEKLSSELSRLSDAVVGVRNSLHRHEAEGKKLV